MRLNGFGETAVQPAKASPVDTIKTIVKEAMQQSGQRLGFLGSHFSEVLGLVPDIERIDMITFELRVGVATFTDITQQVRIPSDYDFELTGITASHQGVSALDLARVTFNMREAGRNFDILTTSLPLSLLCTTTGPASIIEWPRGLYLFRGGAEIQPFWARNANAGAYAGADMTVYVTLIGNLHRKQ